MAQFGGAFGVFAGEDIVAGGIVDRNMDVHAAASLVGKGLGHESRLQPMALGGRLHQSLVHDRIVTSAQHVGLVAKRQFKLPGGKFGNRAFQRQALNIGKGV